MHGVGQSVFGCGLSFIVRLHGVQAFHSGAGEVGGREGREGGSTRGGRRDRRRQGERRDTDTDKRRVDTLCAGMDWTTTWAYEGGIRWTSDARAVEH